jgi:hypothetical protein
MLSVWSSSSSRPRFIRACSATDLLFIIIIIIIIISSSSSSSSSSSISSSSLFNDVSSATQNIRQRIIGLEVNDKFEGVKELRYSHGICPEGQRKSMKN